MDSIVTEARKYSDAFMAGVERIGIPFLGSESPNRRAVSLKEEGNKLYIQKRYYEAIVKYTGAIEHNPTDAVFYFNRSLCYSSLGMWTESVMDAKQCISINNKYMKGYYRAAIVLQTMGDNEQALAIINQGLTLFPNNTDLQRMAEKLDKTILLAKLKSDGDEKFNKDDFEGAIACYTSCIDKISDESAELALKCFSNRALCHYHLGHHSNTIADCSHVLQFKPNNIKALIRRSQALENMGHLSQAMADVETVLALGDLVCGQKIMILATELQRRLIALSEDQPVHLLRKASVEESAGTVCFCMEPMLHGFNTVRLRCRCVLHEHCMVTYVRSNLEDKTLICDKGMKCPYGCGNYVWIDDVDALCKINKSRPISALHGTGISPLEETEAAKFRMWVISASFSRDELVSCPRCATPHWVDRLEQSGVARVRCSNNACRAKFCSSCQVEWHGGLSCSEYQGRKSSLEDSKALMSASAKECPNCHTAVTHYHGHACHHIRGCPGCGIHFCYRCLRAEEENERVRGERSRCVCEEGRWGTFCVDDDILQNLSLLPFPHDQRCGCPICPDCRRDTPCSGCSGDCVVCKGVVLPGPAELHSYCAEEARRYYSLSLKEEGNALFKQQMFEAAAEKFTQALALCTDVTFFSNRSACYAAISLWDKAADDGLECIRLDRSFVKGYLRAAVALRTLGRLVEALDVVNQGLQIDPRILL
eukprot:gene882-1708_t